MPLHLAVASEHPQCVAMLLNAGAASTMDVKNEVQKNLQFTTFQHN